MSNTTPLPAPNLKSATSFEEALAARRSVRQFSSKKLDLSQISQLLWAAQGITHSYGLRTAPSAGALYPLEIYLLTQEDVSHYRPDSHALSVHVAGDLRQDVYRASLNQDSILQAACTVVIAAVYARTAEKYGSDRSPRYVHMEVGHAAQNVLLQAEVLGLGAVLIGAFDDARLHSVLSLPHDHAPLYLIPVGYPQ